MLRPRNAILLAMMALGIVFTTMRIVYGPCGGRAHASTPSTQAPYTPHSCTWM
jgi:hypothetical protein